MPIKTIKLICSYYNILKQLRFIYHLFRYLLSDEIHFKICFKDDQIRFVLEQDMKDFKEHF